MQDVLSEMYSNINLSITLIFREEKIPYLWWCLHILNKNSHFLKNVLSLRLQFFQAV